VEVREKDLLQLDEAHVRTQELALRALCAVEQETVTASPHERRGQGAFCSRHGAGRPKENDVEIHGGGL
jgi:hypothetical protein